MKKYARLRKIVTIFSLVLAALFAINITLNIWLEKALPKLIKNENNTNFIVKYDKLKVDLFSRNIYLQKLQVFPKNTLHDSIKDTGVYGKIASVTIEKFGIWDVLFNQKINAKNIVVTKPEGLFYENLSSQKPEDSLSKKELQQTIKFENFSLKDGNFKIINQKTNQPVLSVSNAHLGIDNIEVSKFSMQNQLPLFFDDFTFSCDSLFYATKTNYELRVHQIKANKSNILLSYFSLKYKLTRKAFVKNAIKEKDLFTIQAKEIQLVNTNWGEQNDVFFFESSNIKFDVLNANIYRNKLPVDDISKKKLYSQMLRELPFNLRVDTLQISNSHVVYEEEKDFNFGAGKLSFYDFNLIATHITGGKNFASSEPVQIKIKNKFMNDAKMEVNWTFNVLDLSDRFAISGKILDLNTQEIESFTKPYSQLTVQGKFESVYFDFSGNDKNANGNFIVNQRDLKLVIYQKKNPNKVSKLKSAIGNLLLDKNAQKDEMKEVAIAVERKQDRSVFNFLWLCLSEGLKKSLI